jgi:hypothetical protein
MSVCCECCVLTEVSVTSRSLVQRRPTRVWCVDVCDPEISRMSRPWSELSRSATGQKKSNIEYECGTGQPVPVTTKSCTWEDN